MKIKVIFSGIIGLLIAISVSQIFSIPPYAGDIYKIYKSGYYSELDRGFEIIKDSFIAIKTMSEPVYGWIFLSDMEKKHNLKIRLYNAKGIHIPAPGDKGGAGDDWILDIINSHKPEAYYRINKDRYFSTIPLIADKSCRFCHGNNPGDMIGVISFERNHDSHIYYSSERVLIFIFVTLFLSFLLFVILKWAPGNKIKEMFDNS